MRSVVTPSRLYADDADWVMANGQRVKGRKAIAEELTKEHATWARTTKFRAMDVTLRELDAGRAIVMFKWEITSDATAGARQGNTVLVVTKSVEGWLIVAGQVAPVAPPK
jgi:uncharacterized protein (TIGR02246 family)